MAWLYGESAARRFGQVENRRRVSGCELARKILDRHHLHQVAIDPASSKEGLRNASSVNRLFLREGTFYGTRMGDLAEALQDALSLVEATRSTLFFLLEALGGVFFRGLILSAWILVGIGSLFQGGRGLVFLGEGIFSLAFFLALAFLAREWEVGERALVSLSRIEGFETDERIRMKKLLQAIRWRPLAELVKFPFSLLSKETHAVPKLK